MSWRTIRKYRVWRAAVIRRDTICQVCSTMRHQNSHHVNHATHFPDERYNAKNGICLCGKYRSQYHNNYHRSTREKCTKYDFDNFLSLINYCKGVL